MEHVLSFSETTCAQFLHPGLTLDTSYGSLSTARYYYWAKSKEKSLSNFQVHVHEGLDKENVAYNGTLLSLVAEENSDIHERRDEPWRQVHCDKKITENYFQRDLS